MIGNCNLGNNIWALREAHINEILILLQGLLYQLQLCVYMSQKKLFHPGVWQRQELQLAAGERGTHLIYFELSPKWTSRNYLYCLKKFITKTLWEHLTMNKGNSIKWRGLTSTTGRNDLVEEDFKEKIGFGMNLRGWMELEKKKERKRKRHKDRQNNPDEYVWIGWRN